MTVLCVFCRCVPDKQRSFALGVQWVIMRTCGSIPGPMIYGAVIDFTCLFWLYPCGNNSEEGACYFYSNSLLSSYLFVLSMSCKVASVTFYGLAMLLYKAPPEEEKHSDSSMGVNISCLEVSKVMKIENEALNDALTKNEDV